MKIELQTTESIVGNFKILHPNGDFLFFSSKKRADWYRRKGLATLEAPDVIKLLFVPNGPGTAGDPYMREPRENICVVCGIGKNLTRHHVVPYSYRRHFSLDMKARQSHDVLAVCCFCHMKYEQSANRFKDGIAVKYSVPLVVTRKNFSKKYYKYITTLQNYADKIPQQRIQEMLEVIAESKGFKSLSTEDIPRLFFEMQEEQRKIDEEWASQGRMIVDKIVDFDEFIKLWRLHFVDTMKPKFLSKNWEIDRKAVGLR